MPATRFRIWRSAAARYAAGSVFALLRVIVSARPSRPAMRAGGSSTVVPAIMRPSSRTNSSRQVARSFTRLARTQSLTAFSVISMLSRRLAWAARVRSSLR